VPFTNILLLSTAVPNHATDATIKLAPTMTRKGDYPNSTSLRIPIGIIIPISASVEILVASIAVTERYISKYPITMLRNAKRLPCACANRDSQCGPV
jgi:hypothetical protein